MGMMAEPMAKAMVETGELELVLTDHCAATSGLFLYYPGRKQVMPKLRAFIDYVREYLPDEIAGYDRSRNLFPRYSTRPGKKTLYRHQKICAGSLPQLQAHNELE